MFAIEIDGSTKKYGDFTAVNNLTLKIKQGEIFALLGTNGAGKTTTIKMLTSLTEQTSGNAKILGVDIKDEKIKSLINVSPQETAVCENLTVKENLTFIADVYGIETSKVDEVINSYSLEEVKSVKAKKLSGGYKRRLSIAMAIITKPKVLFLDEPTLGLDVIARRELWKHIEIMRGITTVVLTTHYLEEAEALSDRVAILSKGKLKMVGTPSELIASKNYKNFEDAFINIATED